MDKLHALANTLLEKETIDGNLVDEILKQVDEDNFDLKQVTKKPAKRTRTKKPRKDAVKASDSAEKPKTNRKTKSKQ